ncbi:MAG: hypothetical protein ABSH24_19025 [Bryobacteraceae bacterium]|jgi:hypothetical protein
MSEEGRRRVVWLVLVIYWLIFFFEGVLRKWIFAGASRYLYFIRDPLVVAVYLVAFFYRFPLKRSVFRDWAVLLAVGAVFVTIIQQLFTADPPNWILLVYGWRNYFLLMPLMFLIATCFRREDLYRLMRHTCWMSVPIAVLVFFQFLAPKSAAINKGFGIGDDEISNAGVAFDVVRTYGVFTAAPGESAFVVSLLAMVLYAWLTPRSKRFVNRPFLILATASAFTCLALSGSRGAVVWAAIVIIVAVSAVPLAVRIGVRVVAPVAIVMIAAVAAPLAFPREWEAFSYRWEGAYVGESEEFGSLGIIGRALFDVISFRYVIPVTPLFGNGLGTAGNAAGRFGRGEILTSANITRGQIDQAEIDRLAGQESDWGRHVIELGPILGLIFVVFRVTLTAWLGVNAFRAARRSRDPLPLLMFAFVGVIFFNGQLVGQGTLGGYGWLFAGFTMALCRETAMSARFRLPGQRELQREFRPQSMGPMRPIRPMTMPVPNPNRR